MKDQFPSARGRINILGEAFEADAPLMEGRDGFDQVLERAAEPIESLDDQRIALAQIEQGILESWAFGHAAADGVGERLPTPSFRKRILLKIQCLLKRGDPRIANQHRRSPLYG